MLVLKVINLTEASCWIAFHFSPAGGEGTGAPLNNLRLIGNQFIKLA